MKENKNNNEKEYLTYISNQVSLCRNDELIGFFFFMEDQKSQMSIITLVETNMG